METAIQQNRNDEAQGEGHAQEVRKVLAAKQVVQAILQVKADVPGKLLAVLLQIEVRNLRVNELR